jgi:hypothetical protein
MFVSKKALPGISFLSVEDKPCGQRTLQFTQAGQSTLPAFVPSYLKDPLINDSNLDLIALFETERVNHG